MKNAPTPDHHLRCACFQVPERVQQLIAEAVHNELVAFLAGFASQHDKLGRCGRTHLTTMLAGKQIWDEKVTTLN